MLVIIILLTLSGGFYMSSFNKDTKSRRLLFFAFVILICFCLLVVKLAWIQIIKNKEYTESAVNQRNWVARVYPPRGIIFDRNLIPLTNRDRNSTILVNRDILQHDQEVQDYIQEITKKDKTEINEIIEASNTIVEITFDNTDKNKFKEHYGIINIEKTERYSDKNYLTHVIGYINESENKGLSGIELAYENILKMEDEYGLISIPVDGKKRQIPGIGYTAVSKEKSKKINSVKLTIDYHIQKVVEDIMDEEDKNGAVIVTDIKSGDILAMASRPNIDRNNKSKHADSKQMDFYNKVIQIGYPPASIFKIVVLLAALEDNQITLNEKFLCKGYEKVGNNVIKCHSFNSGGHGKISVKEAFYDSCNSIFIQIGNRIGSKKIIDTAKRLGFGSKIHIGFEEEIAGNLPEGDELLGPAIGNISIGQGNIEVTPLQVTNLMMIVANNGLKKDLAIADAYLTEDGYKVIPFPRDADERVIDYYNNYFIKKSLEEVVEKGTAKDYVSLDQYGGAAGKTGTAQAVFNKEETKHAWFSGYFPKENPRYVITVLIEDGISGGRTSGTIFEKIAKEIVEMGK